ncbi:MAG: hypothetical protein RL172_2289, partial [Bacteroidota bacterium]
MKKIIIPVDFSTTAANAAAFAGELAVFYGADLFLYHTYEIPVGVGEATYPLFDVSELQKAAEHELEIMAENLSSKLPGKPVIHTKAALTSLQEGLTNLCNHLKPDLVVMGLSGKDALTKLLVGSNTIRAIHYLKYPVLVVPPKADFIPIRKIGFACDYKAVEENTPIEALKKIVKDFNAELYILNVDFNNRNFSADEVHESFKLHDLLSDLKPEYHSIESEDTTEGINQFAERARLDWIVVVPKKHALVQKLFTRSHTRHLLHH